MIKNFCISELQSNGQWGSSFYPGPNVRRKEIDVYFREPVRTKCDKAGETLVQQAAGKMRIRVWEQPEENTAGMLSAKEG